MWFKLLFKLINLIMSTLLIFKDVLSVLFTILLSLFPRIYPKQIPKPSEKPLIVAVYSSILSVFYKFLSQSFKTTKEKMSPNTATITATTSTWSPVVKSVATHAVKVIVGLGVALVTSRILFNQSSVDERSNTNEDINKGEDQEVDNKSTTGIDNSDESSTNDVEYTSSDNGTTDEKEKDVSNIIEEVHSSMHKSNHQNMLEYIKRKASYGNHNISNNGKNNSHVQNDDFTITKFEILHHGAEENSKLLVSKYQEHDLYRNKKELNTNKQLSSIIGGTDLGSNDDKMKIINNSDDENNDPNGIVDHANIGDYKSVSRNTSTFDKILFDNKSNISSTINNINDEQELKHIVTNSSYSKRKYVGVIKNLYVHPINGCNNMELKEMSFKNVYDYHNLFIVDFLGRALNTQNFPQLNGVNIKLLQDDEIELSIENNKKHVQFKFMQSDNKIMKNKEMNCNLQIHGKLYNGIDQGDGVAHFLAQVTEVGGVRLMHVPKKSGESMINIIIKKESYGVDHKLVNTYKPQIIMDSDDDHCFKDIVNQRWMFGNKLNLSITSCSSLNKNLELVKASLTNVQEIKEDNDGSICVGGSCQLIS